MKKSLRIVVAILVVLFWMIRLWNEASPEYEDQPEYYVEENDCDEFFEDDSVTTEPLRTIHRSWKNYQYDGYCTTYGALERAQRKSRDFRTNLRLNWDGDFYGFWNLLYYDLNKHDMDALVVLQDSLNQIAIANNLSRTDLANLIVTFVQDIPYEYVLPEACTGKETKPCNGNVPYGIYSPSEFVYLLKGDCDTRTVLLYTLLENMGFDAVIFNSQEYEHSMLGVNVPSTGDYINYKGTNFYFWETTNVGWMSGVIPPGMNVLAYWTIVLD